jgi:hypothetical protein
MARHVSHGGVPSDMVGEAIVELSSNLAKLKEFMNVVNKQSLINESNRSVVLNVKRRMESIKESIKRVQGAKGYASFVEKMATTEAKQNAEITEDTVNSYVSKFTKSTFEESLRDVLPLIHRVNEEEMEDNRADQIARVKEIILAKDKKTGEKKNKITFPRKPGAEYDYDAIKKQYAEPRTPQEAEEQKKLKLALSIDDLADRVDVDTTDDNKRKNKGHDRAAELSMFLMDMGNSIRSGKGLTKEKIQITGYLRKLATQNEAVETAGTPVNEQFDRMLSEAFSKFEIPA